MGSMSLSLAWADEKIIGFLEASLLVSRRLANLYMISMVLSFLPVGELTLIMLFCDWESDILTNY